MALAHAAPGQIIDLLELERAPPEGTPTALFKSTQLEVLRLQISKGQPMPPHQLAGEITIQCLTGRVKLVLRDTARELKAGQMLYLARGEEHAVEGLEDSSLLVTIVLAGPHHA